MRKDADRRQNFFMEGLMNMKNQHERTVKGFKLWSVVAVVLTLVALVCTFTVLASANTAITKDDLNIGLTLDGGVWSKVYDGTTTADVTLKDDPNNYGYDDKYDLVIDKAEFDSAAAGDRIVTVTFKVMENGQPAANVSVPNPVTFGAKITKKALTWKNNGTVQTAVDYDPDKQGTYTIVSTALTLPGLEGAVAGDGTITPDIAPVVVNGVAKAGEYEKQVEVDLHNDNYTVAPLTVKVTVKPIEITEIVWGKTDFTYTWGDEALSSLSISGKTAAGKTYRLETLIKDAQNNLYDGKVGTYELVVSSPDASISIATGVDTKQTLTVNKKLIEVSMSDATFIGNKTEQKEPNAFNLTVSGDIPADLRANITYKVDGKDFAGTTEYGVYDITATLPDGGNYEFVDAKGNAVTALSAKLYINKQFVLGGTADAPYQLILIGTNGFSGDVDADVTIPEKLDRKAIRGFKVHEAYTLNLEGADGQSFTVLVPISDTMLGKRLEPLTNADLYIYDAIAGTMVSATEKGYTVTLKDGYFEVEGISASGAGITFVVAPEYNAPFWLTAWGIALLIFLVLALLVLLFLIGMYLRRAKDTSENEAVAVDTGEAEEAVPTELEEKVDEDEFLAAQADAAADALEGIDAEADAEDTEGLADAVADAMDEMKDEASEIDLTEEETTVPEDMADAMADELADSVEAEEDGIGEADEDALRAAVAAAIAESADADGAILLAPEYPVEDFKAVVDAVVSDAMARTMLLPEEETTEEVIAEVVEETAEEATEEVAAEAVEETAEEVAAEAVEENAEEATEEVAAEAVEETAEEATEEVAAEAVEETAEEATEEDVAEAAEETAEEVAEEDVAVEAVRCTLSGEEMVAIVSDSVNEAFELVTVDGVTPAAVEGTTMATIEDAVDGAADDNIPGNWTVDMANTVIDAVVAELAARLLSDEEPPAEEAVETFAAVEEPVVENDEDEDEDEEEEENSFGGFGSMDLDFIDAVAEADQYALMLEQEARGEVQLVTRYRRSFRSRMIQSQGNVQDYYNILKNALLTYKGVKNRISWNYEAYNRGRAHLAKMNAKTKTLYLYLALDPAELADTKYGIVDVSSKKKYATVPVLMKIKGERKFKYALELIEKLCAEQMELQKMEVEEVDYREAYQTTEQLVEAGVIKKLVASIPVTVYGAEATEDAPTEAASASAEAQEVTFVEPTTVPAVEEAGEEIAADAPATDDEPKQI